MASACIFGSEALGNLRSDELAGLASGSPSPQQTAVAVTDAAWERSQQDPELDGRAKPDDISVVVIDVNGDG